MMTTRLTVLVTAWVTGATSLSARKATCARGGSGRSGGSGGWVRGARAHWGRIWRGGL
jgi:hypothetical protein